MRSAQFREGLCFKHEFQERFDFGADNFSAIEVLFRIEMTDLLAAGPDVYREDFDDPA